MEELKNKNISFRVTRDQYEVILAKGRKEGLKNMTDIIRKAVMEKYITPNTKTKRPTNQRIDVKAIEESNKRIRVEKEKIDVKTIQERHRRLRAEWERKEDKDKYHYIYGKPAFYKNERKNRVGFYIENPNSRQFIKTFREAGLKEIDMINGFAIFTITGIEKISKGMVDKLFKI